MSHATALRAAAAGRARYQLTGLKGASGAAHAVATEVAARPGVTGALAYPRTGNIVVWYDPDQIDPVELGAELERVVAAAAGGAAVAERGGAAETGEVARLVLGGAVLALLGLRRLLRGRGPALLGPRGSTVAAAVTLFTGYPFFRGALRSLSSREATGTDALVSAATVASLLLRENVAALTVLWLLNIGELLQALTLRRTRRAIEDLLRVGDDTVWLVRGDGVEVEVPLSTVTPGDVVAVHTHRKIPVDGVVVDGEGVVDEAPITGESLPSYKGPGASVFAGTLMVDGRLVVRARKVGDDTAVGRIIARVETAQADRAPIQTLANRFSRRFVPLSFALAGAVWVVTRDVRRSMTMLLIACPCAAGLSTPTAISAGIGHGARRGTLIKGGTHLEQAGRITAFVFDKTGTLTTGRPLVTSVTASHPGYTPEQVLALAASGEIHARHPLAQAVVRHTEEQHIEIPIHEECEVLMGMGMRADLRGNRIVVGSPTLMEEFGVTVADDAREEIARLHADGHVAVCCARNEDLVGVIGVTDAIRDEAPWVVARLRELGVQRTVMLTGDHPTAAASVAAALQITEYRAETMPEDKLAVVAELQEQGYVVAVVGDGVNDAPALALADIGIAMGAGGSDVAIEAADVALAGSHLPEVVRLVELGRQTLRVVRQNYGLAIGVNTIGLLAGAGGVLDPMLAAVLHNASSVAVVSNSARLVGRGDGVPGSSRPRA
ncbi:MAG TPA: cation-translocating P-type ATPase [Egibacteraceae bacterium]|nr:cation-translocating P-type ATPase [Egibacteraceae bacterium]